jgi:hypothetical protein
VSRKVQCATNPGAGLCTEPCPVLSASHRCRSARCVHLEMASVQPVDIINSNPGTEASTYSHCRMQRAAAARSEPVYLDVMRREMVPRRGSSCVDGVDGVDLPGFSSGSTLQCGLGKKHSAAPPWVSWPLVSKVVRQLYQLKFAGVKRKQIVFLKVSCVSRVPVRLAILCVLLFVSCRRVHNDFHLTTF